MNWLYSGDIWHLHTLTSVHNWTPTHIDNEMGDYYPENFIKFLTLFEEDGLVGYF